MHRSSGVFFLSPLLFFLLSASFASANSVELLNFNYLKNVQPVGNFYDGGTSNPAVPNYGVTFSSNFYGLTLQGQGGNGYISPDPTQTPAIFIQGANGTVATGTMNVNGGFSGGINFYFTSPFSVTVKVWSGANGTGTLLATRFLAPNDTPNCFQGTLCAWSPQGIGFSGTAGSVTFTGLSNSLGIADITLGQTATAVPEPSSFYLLATGIVGICAHSVLRMIRGSKTRTAA